MIWALVCVLVTCGEHACIVTAKFVCIVSAKLIFLMIWALVCVLALCSEHACIVTATFVCVVTAKLIFFNDMCIGVCACTVWRACLYSHGNVLSV